jgi:hypothetical protein
LAAENRRTSYDPSRTSNRTSADEVGLARSVLKDLPLGTPGQNTPFDNNFRKREQEFYRFFD